MACEKYIMIIPTTNKDFLRTKRNYENFFKYLSIKEIIFIGSNELRKSIREDQQIQNGVYNISYINENEIVPYSDVMRAMTTRVESQGFKMAENSKPGWYYQQFLKMAFTNICQDSYYLSWDADTIPLHEISMVNDDGKPFFDLKAEYNKAYFNTIRTLFHEEKVMDKSFISEHMLFNCDLMREMISEIEASNLTGDKFYEKIFYAIDIYNLAKGFSEFETYGTWVSCRHPDFYELRDFKSMRMAGYFFRPEELTQEDAKWLSKDFDALTFESYNPYAPALAQFFNNSEYRNTMTAGTIYDTFLKSDFIKNNYKNLPC